MALVSICDAAACGGCGIGYLSEKEAELGLNFPEVGKAPGKSCGFGLFEIVGFNIQIKGGVGVSVLVIAKKLDLKAIFSNPDIAYLKRLAAGDTCNQL